MSASVAARRCQTILLGAFSALALLLAAVGIFGVLSYSVAQRTGELGIRRALGADADSVMRLVVSQGLALSGVGIALGGTAALALTRVLRNPLFEIAPTDPAAFSAAALLLAAISLAACYIPARRAARANPIEALRTE